MTYDADLCLYKEFFSLDNIKKSYLDLGTNTIN